MKISFGSVGNARETNCFENYQIKKRRIKKPLVVYVSRLFERNVLKHNKVHYSWRIHLAFSKIRKLGALKTLLASSVQFSSITESIPALCNPMNCSTPGLPVHHRFPELTQTHVHRLADAIQPSHPLSSLSPPAPNPSQNWALFQ